MLGCLPGVLRYQLPPSDASGFSFCSISPLRVFIDQNLVLKVCIILPIKICSSELERHLSCMISKGGRGFIGVFNQSIRKRKETSSQGIQIKMKYGLNLRAPSSQQKKNNLPDLLVLLHLIIYERKLAKERSKEDHLFAVKDKFVTGACKRKLAEQAKWLEEER
ncbi:hypothetical protein L1987_04375 [Smallanthus sonchifolius]|uniref:Uncharacterized protein n=1 Tax=Smallanthus sonchifolius TaxID=185202 RepID=A0ACB9KDA2_9ASTR|nr:hypothetical protein L1987_04375 [Smallanthus sonchifolius]